jgi:subtilisin family serine protease
MKKAVLIAVSLLVLAGLAGAEKFISVPLVESSQDVFYRDDAFIINLAASTGKVRVAPQVAATGKFGIPALDALSLKFGINKVETLFPEADLALVSAGVTDMSRYYRISFDSRAVALQDVLGGFSKSALVETAEPIGVHRLDFTPNDTYYAPGQAFGYQWDMEQASDQDLDASCAWDQNKGSTNVIVADLDSGFRYYHRDLGGASWTGGPSATGTTGNIWINTLDAVDGVDNDGNGRVDDHIGYDFVNGGFQCATSLGEDCSTPDNDPADFNGHGTHTAGTIAAISNNARGVAGMAGGDAGGSQTGIGNGCKIMTLRIGWHATDGNGYVGMDYAAQAFNYAAAINNNPSQTAKVVAANCSWGSSSLSALQTAIQNAVSAGILICKSAGNSNNQTADFINAKGSDTTMSVAATDSSDKKASFSSYGTWVDVSAPGVDIISTYHVNTDPANDYVAKASGTSMSSPHVAGLAGLIKSQFPSWNRSQVSAQIKSTTDNIDALLQRRHRGKMGTGRINACRALGGSPSAAAVGVEPIAEAEATGKATLGNAPNPFNANTAISYYVPRDAQVSLEVYNIRGQKVKTLVNEYQSTGSRTIFWDGANSSGDVVASGVYFYKLSIDQESVTKKMTFLR